MAGQWPTRRRPRRRPRGGVRCRLRRGADVRPVRRMRRIRTRTARPWAERTRTTQQRSHGRRVGLRGAGVGVRRAGGGEGPGAGPLGAASDPVWACRRMGSTRAGRTICSGRGRVLRSGTGRHRGVRGRRDIWTARPRRRCGRLVRRDRRLGRSSGVGRVAARLELPQLHEPRHAGVDRHFEQVLEVAPQPGRHPLGDASLDLAFRVDERVGAEPARSSSWPAGWSAGDGRPRRTSGPGLRSTASAVLLRGALQRTATRPTTGRARTR